MWGGRNDNISNELGRLPTGRKAKITCANCNYVAKDERELDSHMKKRTYIITKL